MDQHKLYAQEYQQDVINNVFFQAITNKVSDIHFEPEDDSLTIRFRIDGLLHQYAKLEGRQQEEIVSRLKVLASLNITEHHMPQDGYFEYVHQNKIYNVRVSTMPTIYAETIVCRIHNREDVLIDLPNLGLNSEQLEVTKQIISNSSGIVLATGPTGSGKTSLLYSIINNLNRPDKNIITVEDPIEYHLTDIRQVQINESLGLTFDKVMRSIVRQDPDVIMLGEIRDAETAQMAAQVSLIGTAVFSTFHTFDVPALIARLKEMGVTNSIIAQAIKGIISTRLVRKICTACRAPYVLTEQEKALVRDLPTTAQLYKGKGCDQCRGQGYLGRTGIFEIVKFEEGIREAIIEEKSASYVNELLKKNQVQTLTSAALEKVAQGITTVEEVVRVLGLPVFQRSNTPGINEKTY